MTLARDRRRRAGAEAAVLHQHRDRDARRFGGRKGDEPGVIAAAARRHFASVFFVLRATVNTCAVPVLPAMV